MRCLPQYREAAAGGGLGTVLIELVRLEDATGTISGRALASRPSASASGDRGVAGPGALASRGVRTTCVCSRSTRRSCRRCSRRSPKN